MSDVAVLSGGLGVAAANNVGFRAEVSAGISVDVGVPLTPPATVGSGVGLARANAVLTSNVIGLAATAGEFPGSVDLALSGPFSMTTAQWDAITGQVGGLTPGTVYYLSSVSPGKILTTKPPGGAGNFITQIGFAYSPTTMILKISVPVTD